MPGLNFSFRGRRGLHNGRLVDAPMPFTCSHRDVAKAVGEEGTYLPKKCLSHLSTFYSCGWQAQQDPKILNNLATKHQKQCFILAMAQIPPISNLAIFQHVCKSLDTRHQSANLTTVLDILPNKTKSGSELVKTNKRKRHFDSGGKLYTRESCHPS